MIQIRMFVTEMTESIGNMNRRDALAGVAYVRP